VLHAAHCKYRTQKFAKNRHLSTIEQLCRAISSQLRHLSPIGKKLLKQQYFLHIFSQYGELGPLTANIGSRVQGTPGNFNGFRVLASILLLSEGQPNCTMFRCLLGWYTMCTFSVALAPKLNFARCKIHFAFKS